MAQFIFGAYVLNAQIGATANNSANLNEEIRVSTENIVDTGLLIKSKKDIKPLRIWNLKIRNGSNEKIIHILPTEKRKISDDTEIVIRTPEKKKLRVIPIEKKCNCMNDYDPVCGINGKTYLNPCELKCANLKMEHKGVCAEDNNTNPSENLSIAYSLNMYMVPPFPGDIGQDRIYWNDSKRVKNGRSVDGGIESTFEDWDDFDWNDVTYTVQMKNNSLVFAKRAYSAAAKDPAHLVFEFKEPKNIHVEETGKTFCGKKIDLEVCKNIHYCSWIKTIEIGDYNKSLCDNSACKKEGDTIYCQSTTEEEKRYEKMRRDNCPAMCKQISEGCFCSGVDIGERAQAKAENFKIKRAIKRKKKTITRIIKVLPKKKKPIILPSTIEAIPISEANLTNYVKEYKQSVDAALAELVKMPVVIE